MSAPTVTLGTDWPTKDPHPSTGWAEPRGEVTLAFGLLVRVSSWGDAVPGGYNGGFVLRDSDGAEVGRIEYQSAGSSVLIAMIEVSDAFRRSGASDALLMRLVAEFPGAQISAGLLTPDGERWWSRVKHAINSGA